MRKLIVKTSIELTKAQKTRLEEGIRSKETQQVEFSYIIDTKIIGGMVIIDGEKLLDASISKGLYSIKDATKKLVSEEKQGIAVKDIPALLKKKLQDMTEQKLSFESCGKVVSAADGVVSLSGLSDCQFGELIVIGNSGYALALNLEKDTVGAILLSDVDSVEYGDMAYTTGKIIEVPVGQSLLGRVVNPLGTPMDDKGAINQNTNRKIEYEAPRIIDRQKVDSPLSTGILAIDSMVPIGKGQRELIIGDRQTGKTSIAVDTIINQKDKDVICIYVAIGQRAAAVSKLVRTLEAHNAMEYTTVVLSTASDSAPLQYIAPYTGAAIAEHFMYQGKDVLIVYDDLSKHAVSYRTISLLLKRPAGREAYPGDVFYIHSKLLERAARLSDKLGGGSITALPIIETQAGDISAYIPTNVISITDGQIYLEKELFNAGQRPAVNVGLSVSRVGGAAQRKLMRKLSSKLRLDIAHYKELSIFAQFGSSLDSTTREILTMGAKTVEALKQPEYQPLDLLKEEIYLFVIANNYLRKIPTAKISAFLEKYYQHISTNYVSICQEMKSTQDLSEASSDMLHQATKEFIADYTGVK